MEALCEFLLRSSTAAIGSPADAAEWLTTRPALPFAASIERAAAAGFLADRVGYAFAAGYQEALRSLLRGTPFSDASMQPMALCATEEGGAHPRAIQTTLSPSSIEDPRGGGRLNGRKTFVTLGSLARWLLLIVRSGVDAQGRSQLAAVCLPSDRCGIALAAAPTTPFVPEIPHSLLTLCDVEVTPSDCLPGDGYDRYLKPFRTLEDLHVHAALLGHLIQIARRFAWPRERICEALMLLCALLPMASASPLSPATHLALAGVIAATSRWVQDTLPLWGQVDSVIAARFQRDQHLLSVASQARSARLDSAWRAWSSA